MLRLATTIVATATTRFRPLISKSLTQDKNLGRVGVAGVGFDDPDAVKHGLHGGGQFRLTTARPQFAEHCAPRPQAGQAEGEDCEAELDDDVVVVGLDPCGTRRHVAQDHIRLAATLTFQDLPNGTLCGRRREVVTAE